MAAKQKTEKGTFHKILLYTILIIAVSINMVQANTVFNPAELFSKKPKQKKTSEDILKDIYKEVSELGKREKENFIKREFHFDLDENPTNSEEHIVVLIYDIEKREKMVVQVTYFEAEGFKYSVKYAKDIKLVSCHLDSEKLEIDKCDFSKKEMKTLFTDILKGIQEEKKLYKLIDKKDVEHSGIKKKSLAEPPL